jgi:carboxylate-amine ligase
MGAAMTPDWARWRAEPALPEYTLGVEEEIMLLDPRTWELAQAIEHVLDELPGDLRSHVGSETHSAAVELSTGIHTTVAGASDELGYLQCRLADVLEPMRLACAACGTHPSAVWQDMVISARQRHQVVSGSMRALARREPTFALHVHVGVSDPEDAVRAANAMRAHLPMLLALSANSPFWQGRDTGLASSRTPLFQAFPRVGIPRAFTSYDDYVQAVDLLIRCQAFPDPTFLWWDVRPQPRFGTVETRIMDVQSTITGTRALVALVQCLVRLEVEEGYASPALVNAPEALDENRFIAARDGIDASLLDPLRNGRVTLRDLVDDVLEACAPHAAALRCSEELALVPVLFEDPSAERQRRLAREAGGLAGLVRVLAGDMRQAVALRSGSGERDAAAVGEPV